MSWFEEGELYYNGCSSIKDFNLHIEEYPDIPLTTEEYESEYIYMRKESIITNTGIYKDKKITFTFTKHDEDELLNFDRIYDWLLNCKDNKLMYGTIGKCLRVKKVVLGKFKQEFKTFGSFDVTFICSPFWESNDEIEYIFTDNENRFYYEGNIETSPKFKIYGNGKVVFSVDDERVTIDDVKDYVIIDNKLMKCLDKNNQSKDFDMSGNFCELENGQHVIKLIQNISKIEVTFIEKWR